MNAKLKDMCISCGKEGYDNICKDCRAQGICSVWAIMGDMQNRLKALEALVAWQGQQR
jgi:hypothetical protein